MATVPFGIEGTVKFFKDIVGALGPSDEKRGVIPTRSTSLNLRTRCSSSRGSRSRLVVEKVLADTDRVDTLRSQAGYRRWVLSFPWTLRYLSSQSASASVFASLWAQEILR